MKNTFFLYSFFPYPCDDNGRIIDTKLLSDDNNANIVIQSEHAVYNNQWNT